MKNKIFLLYLCCFDIIFFLIETSKMLFYTYPATGCYEIAQEGAITIK